MFEQFRESSKLRLFSRAFRRTLPALATGCSRAVPSPPRAISLHRRLHFQVHQSEGPELLERHSEFPFQAGHPCRNQTRRARASVRCFPLGHPIQDDAIKDLSQRCLLFARLSPQFSRQAEDSSRFARVGRGRPVWLAQIPPGRGQFPAHGLHLVQHDVFLLHLLQPILRMVFMAFTRPHDRYRNPFRSGCARLCQPHCRRLLRRQNLEAHLLTRQLAYGPVFPACRFRQRAAGPRRTGGEAWHSGYLWRCRPHRGAEVEADGLPADPLTNTRLLCIPCRPGTHRPVETGNRRRKGGEGEQPPTRATSGLARSQPVRSIRRYARREPGARPAARALARCSSAWEFLSRSVSPGGVGCQCWE